jgi:hypothetical protein
MNDDIIRLVVCTMDELVRCRLVKCNRCSIQRSFQAESFLLDCGSSLLELIGDGDKKLKGERWRLVSLITTKAQLDPRPSRALLALNS